MHPDKKQVFPVMPEAIANTDGEKKQNCKTKAVKRLLKKLHEAHPRQGFILGGDWFMSHQPMIETTLEYNTHFCL
jgi:hypothetical protein